MRSGVGLLDAMKGLGGKQIGATGATRSAMPRAVSAFVALGAWPKGVRVWQRVQVAGMP